MEKAKRLVHLTPITAEQATEHYGRIKHNPDRECASEIARRCQNFELRSGNKFAVYGLVQKGGTCWIDAAYGVGDWFSIGIAIIESQAREGRFNSVGLQTSRRGLVKKLQAAGYAIAQQSGHIYEMKKTMTHTANNLKGIL